MRRRPHSSALGLNLSFQDKQKVSYVFVTLSMPMADDPEHPDLFLLTDSERGNSYKFQAGNRMNAMLWFKHLSAACHSNQPQAPTNLMTFE